MIKILVNNVGGFRLSIKELQKVVETAAKLNKKISGEVEINIVGESEIKKLNKAWRGQNSSTDVLSFAWQEEEKLPSKCLGQIFICYPVIKKQAKEYGVTIRQEFYRMVIHGLLHLIGFDHIKQKEALKMFTEQDKILNKALSL